MSKLFTIKNNVYWCSYKELLHSSRVCPDAGQYHLPLRVSSLLGLGLTTQLTLIMVALFSLSLLWGLTFPHSLLVLKGCLV